jgi:hypothetical protein
MKLLGSGTAAITPSGATMLMEDVAWRSSWVDAGATAADAVDCNLTSRVQAFGAGAWALLRCLRHNNVYALKLLVAVTQQHLL